MIGENITVLSHNQGEDIVIYRYCDAPGNFELGISHPIIFLISLSTDGKKSKW